MRPSNQSSRKVAPTTKAIHLAAPLGGVNTLMGASAMATNDCISLYNLVPGDYGLRSRDGYTIWQRGMNTKEVRTLMSFGGATEADDRVFAVTQEGIWDVTVSGAAPVHVVTFTPTAGNLDKAGWGSFTNFVTLNEANILIYCDETEGTYFYTGSTHVWVKGTTGNGANQIESSLPANPLSIDNLVSVVGWKNRLWYIERNTGTAWYTGVGAYSGKVTPFQFGNKFLLGGTLLNLWNWTVDGGWGIDDYLVGMSSKGDIVIYQGTDPTAATDGLTAGFNMKGVWNVGQPPRGRRQATAQGGDLLFLTQKGVVPLSQLLQGQAVTENIFSSKKISSVINADMAATINEYGWEMALHPRRNLLLVSTPSEYGRFPGQYCMFLPTNAWGYYREVPARTWCQWRGRSLFGTVDGRVCEHVGDMDNFDPSAPLTGEIAITWTVLTGFTDFGSPGLLKRGQYIRPMFLANAQIPTYLAELRYNFDTSQITQSPVVNRTTVPLWDVARWETAKWAGGVIPEQRFVGARGMGQYVAVALKGASLSACILVGFDVLFDEGGFM